MKQTSLRLFRIVFSLLLILFTSLLFIDIKEFIPGKCYGFVLFPQFIPSVISFLHAASLMSAGFLLVLVLTLLFGRVYCSFICPLGTMQDFISYFSKKIKFIRWFKHSKPFSILRYSILIVTVLLFVLNLVILVNLLDPYSNFGRIVNGLVRPLVIFSNNFVANIFERFNIYLLAPMQLKTNVTAVLFPLVVLLVLLVMAGKRGRLFCNTICPVGTLLGLISKVSLFKIKIDKISCISCGKCAHACKAECINIKNKTVDMGRCVACMDCISSCETKDIKYVFNKVGDKKEQTGGKRKFLANSINCLLLFLGVSKVLKAEGPIPDHGNKKYRPTENKYEKTFHVSPPGSESHAHFNSACTACHLCVAACPTKVLQPSVLQYGLKGFMQPHMDYSTNYCNFDCTKCSEVCPTGAILPVSLGEKKTIQLGKVVFIIKNCVVYTENTACGSCAEHCPTKAVRMVPYKDNLTIPETNDKICIGCGACEYACPMKPYKAIYVDGHDFHMVAEKPKIEELKVEIEEDFPF